MTLERSTRVGLVAGGLGAYWPRFPELLPQPQASARRVAEHLSAFDCAVVGAGFVSDAQEGSAAAEKLRVADCDLTIGFLTTYLTSSMLAPIAQRSGSPLAYCGACPLPEMADAFRRVGVEFRSVSGPAHLAISARRPLLRGLGVHHGKRGWGVSVEFDVKHGPVTLLGQERDGRFTLVASEGAVVPGPLEIGDATSRVDFGCDPGEWTDTWSGTGVDHHWALGVGHRVAELEAVADLLGLELRAVRV